VKGLLRHVTAAACLALLTVAAAADAADPPPAWAYPFAPANAKPAPDDGSLQHVPDSSVSYPLRELRDYFSAPDWHPQDHPAMPDIVAHGRKPAIPACGFCHRAEGAGGPENANLAGLPASYILQQLADYKSGKRGTAVPDRLPPTTMISLARALSDADARDAAEYFAALPHRPNTKVVEAREVPTTYVASGWFLSKDTSGAKEPIGQRIVEVPEDTERHERRDSRTPFIAYVPVGSIARGRALVMGGGGKVVPCSTCHGPNLRGLAPAPPIVGRSPSYVTRQLYDIQQGSRNGLAVQPMKVAIEKLSSNDMLNIAAYLGAQSP
jgi:cytochrome c553